MVYLFPSLLRKPENKHKTNNTLRGALTVGHSIPHLSLYMFPVSIIDVTSNYPKPVDRCGLTTICSWFPEAQNIVSLYESKRVMGEGFLVFTHFYPFINLAGRKLNVQESKFQKAICEIDVCFISFHVDIKMMISEVLVIDYDMVLDSIALLGWKS